MNFDMKKLNSDEVEIDIKSIIDRCIEKIKFILVIGLICAVILPTLIYVKESASYKSNKEQGEAEEVVLSKDEQYAVDQYVVLHERKMQLEDFIDRSIFMQLDLNHTYKAKLQYYFVSDNEAGYDYACSVKNYLSNGAFVDALNESIVNDEKVASSDLMGVAHYEGSAILNIELLAATEEECKLYAETLNNIINSYTEKIQQGLGACRVEMIQSDIVCEYSWSVYNGQKEYLQLYESINADILTCEEELNSNQMKVISMMYQDPNADSEIQNELKPKWNVKYAILGGVAGVVAGVGLVVLFLLFGGRIQSKGEIQKRLQVAELGCVNKDLDKMDMVTARIKSLLLKQDIHTIKLISSNVALKEEQIKELMQRLSEEGIVCEGVDNILCDDMALERLIQEQNVILVETIGKTKVKDLYKEATICKEMNIKIIGYLMV